VRAWLVAGVVGIVLLAATALDARDEQGEWQAQELVEDTYVFDVIVPTSTPTVTPIPPTATATPEPTATPIPYVPPVYAPVAASTQVPQAGALTEDQVRGILISAGWPGHAIERAIRVADCESDFIPSARNAYNVHVLGLFQVWWSTWFPYALGLGLVEPWQETEWADPYTNARVALGAYLYDESRGYPEFHQWQCKG